MKNLFSLRVFLYSCLLFVMTAQLSAQNTATIVLYRPNAWAGSAAKAKVTLGEQKVKLKNKQLTAIEVPIGNYDISNERRIIGARKSHFLLTAEANKTYYFRYRYINCFFYAIDEFILVDEEFAKKEIAQIKLKKA
jgi:hypothetical protein